MSDGWDGMVKIGHRSSRSAFGANFSALKFGLDDLPFSLDAQLI